MTESHCIVRTKNAGVFAGTLYDYNQETRHATMHACRRIWYWKGANSLSDLAVNGTRAPNECKISPPTQEHLIAEVIEIIPTTTTARNSIIAVRPWQHE